MSAKTIDEHFGQPAGSHAEFIRQQEEEAQRIEMARIRRIIACRRGAEVADQIIKERFWELL